MGLFDKLSGPVFLKEDSEAERQLSALEAMKKSSAGQGIDAIEREIAIVKAGIAGEKQVRFELENSHIPMFVLHDLYLEYEGLSAQIDYLIVTRAREFVVECKHLYGDIEINNHGDFIRTMDFGKFKKKEGIYSPVTQNRRHLELIKQIRGAEKNILTKGLFEKHFFENYRSVVVLANPKTVLHDRYAPKEVKNQVIRADQLSEFIRKVNAEPGTETVSEKEMEKLAREFLAAHKAQNIDYGERYKHLLQAEDAPEATTAQAKDTEPVIRKAVVCPKCGAPMVLRKASKGANAGNEFYGCSRFPNCRGIVNVADV